MFLPSNLQLSDAVLVSKSFKAGEERRWLYHSLCCPLVASSAGTELSSPGWCRGEMVIAAAFQPQLGTFVIKYC